MRSLTKTCVFVFYTHTQNVREILRSPGYLAYMVQIINKGI